ncbi:MAG: hypothetical protein ACI85V_001987, partial [bacterium]
HAPSLLKHEPNYSYTEDRTLSLKSLNVYHGGSTQTESPGVQRSECPHPA